MLIPAASKALPMVRPAASAALPESTSIDRVMTNEVFLSSPNIRTCFTSSVVPAGASVLSSPPLCGVHPAKIPIKSKAETKNGMSFFISAPLFYFSYATTGVVAHNARQPHIRNYSVINTFRRRRSWLHLQRQPSRDLPSDLQLRPRW